MKQFNFKNVIVLILFASLISSCDKDDSEDLEPKTIAGRFDDTPFVWDTEPMGKTKEQVFVGDLNILPIDFQTEVVGVADAKSDKYFIGNDLSLYLGAVYPTSSFLTSFAPEITKPKNPIDVIFKLSDPYIGEITNETGSIGYVKLLKKMINSNEYKKHLAGKNATVSFFITQYNSPADIEKAFKGNKHFGKMFSSEVSSKSTAINVKSRLLAQIVNSNFLVYMDDPTIKRPLFKEDSTSTRYTSENSPIYIKSLTYGLAAFVAIESEYPYDEVERAFVEAAAVKFRSAALKENKHISNVLSKSIITLFYLPNTVGAGSGFKNNLEALSDIATANFTENIGYPVYLQGRYVYRNSVFYEETTSTGEGVLNSKFRRDRGGLRTNH